MTCKNCNYNVAPDYNYCADCGGKIVRNRLTLKNLALHFSEHFLNYDNTFLKTFITLFTKPEKVIDGYINGLRKKYVNVISYFAIALTLSGIMIFVLNKFFPATISIESWTPAGSANFQEKNMAFTQEYQSILYMLMVPLYALTSQLVFLNIKKYNYTEHIVINMYLSAHFSIITCFIIIILAAFFGVHYVSSGMLLLVVQILYSMYVFKKLYKLSLKRILWKTCLFLIIGFAIFIFISIIYAVVMFLTGDLQEIFESGKAAAGSN